MGLELRDIPQLDDPPICPNLSELGPVTSDTLPIVAKADTFAMKNPPQTFQSHCQTADVQSRLAMCRSVPIMLKEVTYFEW